MVLRKRVKKHTRWEAEPHTMYWITSAKMFKQNKSKGEGRVAFHAIHVRCLGLNHISAIASEAEVVLQTSTYYGKKKA